MKRIAAITMVRGDAFFLRKWTAWYGGQLGEENLYILLDGRDEPLPDWCPKAHVIPCDRVAGQVAQADKGRIERISDEAAKLFAVGYDLVIGTDADEMLAVDPKLGVGLAEFLSGLDVRTAVSGLGLDVGQKRGEETDITAERPFLEQRHYAQLATRYTKASVLGKPLRGGSGFHRAKGCNLHIVKDLYLFHFGSFDENRLRARFADGDRLSQGWEHHLRKRCRTIDLVSTKKALDFDRWTAFARRFQTVCRPPYAWNKPAMAGLKLVVRIPDRFTSLGL